MPKVDVVSIAEIEKKAERELEKIKEKQISDILDEHIKNNDKFKSSFSSGFLHDGSFFQTIFLKKNGKYSPFVFTDKGKFIQVEDNRTVLLKAGVNKLDITEEDIYFFFEYEGIKYKFLTDIFFKDNLRINTINNEVINLAKEMILPKIIYDNLKNRIMEYWDHFNQYEYDVAIAFILLSYISRALGKTFYIVLQGKEDTGKSTLQKTIALLQFNGRFSGKGTVAVTSRLIHCLGIKTNQDEFDKMAKEEKKMFIGFLNTGLYADGSYSFVDTNKKKIQDQIIELYSFGEKTFSTNNLSQFDNSFLSRVYQLVTTRQGKKLKDINDLSQGELQNFQHLRNELFICCVKECVNIKQSIKELKDELENEGNFGRKTDVNSIILGVIKYFQGEYYKEVKQHLKEKAGLIEEERSNTKEGLTFGFITNKFLSEEKTIEISNKEIVDYISGELSLNDDESKRLKYSVGWILKNYGLLRKKENVKKGIRGNKKYILERSVFLDMLNRFQYKELLDKINNELGRPISENGNNGKIGNVPTISTNPTISTYGLPEHNQIQTKDEVMDIILGSDAEEVSQINSDDLSSKILAKVRRVCEIQQKNGREPLAERSYIIWLLKTITSHSETEIEKSISHEIENGFLVEQRVGYLKTTG